MRRGLISGVWTLLLAVMPMRAQEAKDPKEDIPLQLPERVETFTVRTRSKMNEKLPFYLRVPKNYQKGKAHRLLFLCPVYNELGLKLLSRSEDWLKIADERGWFVMTASFQQDGVDVRNRELSYYYPEGFSGKATLKALEIAAKKYDIDTERLLMDGLSGGAQFVHRFALWAPERVTAVAVHSSSWLDKPNERCKQVAWLITIGEADPTYPESLAMVNGLRELGAAPLLQSYVGAIHELHPKAAQIAKEFLIFYDEYTRADLGKRRTRNSKPEEMLALKGEEMPFVGDTLGWKVFPNTQENREAIREDVRIFLPSEKIAKLWGESMEEAE